MNYDKIIDDCFKALDEGRIDEMKIKIEIGDHKIELPVDADSVTLILEAIKEYEKSSL